MVIHLADRLQKGRYGAHAERVQQHIINKQIAFLVELEYRQIETMRADAEGMPAGAEKRIANDAARTFQCLHTLRQFMDPKVR